MIRLDHRFTDSTAAFFRINVDESVTDNPLGNLRDRTVADARPINGVLAPLLYAGMRARRIGAEVYGGRWENVGTPGQLVALNADASQAAATGDAAATAATPPARR